MNAFSRDYQPQMPTDPPKKRRKPSTAFHAASKHFTVTPRRSELDYAHTAKLMKASI